MPKFRKKPVIVEAVQFEDTSESLAAISEMGLAPVRVEYSSYPPFIRIPTLEGELRARRGDYIIKGIKGEFYPCKEGIFHATYELIEENNT